MVPSTNDFRGRFAVVYEHGFLPHRVLVRSARTEHNHYFQMRQGTSTPVVVLPDGQIVSGWRIPRNIRREQMVQSAGGRAEPFDLDAHLSPPSFEAVTLPVIDRLARVERPAISEVESRPHTPMIGE